jgi:hypothetical protein
MLRCGPGLVNLRFSVASLGFLCDVWPVMLFRVLHRWRAHLALIALLSLFGQFAAPQAAARMMARDGVPATICGAPDVKPQPLPSPSRHHQDCAYCPLCAASVAPAPLLPDPPAIPLISRVAPVFLAGFVQPRAPPLFALIAYPRGPPVNSN